MPNWVWEYPGGVFEMGKSRRVSMIPENFVHFEKVKESRMERQRGAGEISLDSCWGVSSPSGGVSGLPSITQF